VRPEFLSFSDLRSRSCREQALAVVVSDHRHERVEKARGECQTRLERFERQVAGTAAAGRLAAAATTAACFASVALAFWYWGLPYAYGMRITAEQNAARRWNRKW
jgi:hypothetical protein